MEKTTAVSLWKCFVVAGAIMAACYPAHAQSVVGAQISGVVTDPTGAVIPSAQIKATQTESGQTRTTVSTSNGAYSLPLPRSSLMRPERISSSDTSQLPKRLSPRPRSISSNPAPCPNRGPGTGKPFDPERLATVSAV